MEGQGGMKGREGCREAGVVGRDGPWRDKEGLKGRSREEGMKGKE